MVRQSKQTPDQKKKDAHRNKSQQLDKPAPKKSPESAVWPCRINGCNKQFAREADLKRHQRTTKLHSVPGFACPQCDARFTRTDALRRHQKSRHNGVVIEPADGADRSGSMADEDPHSSGSRSKSRSRTPSKENPTAPPSFPPSTGPPGGPQSYYRQHTFAGVMIPPPGMMVDGHYSPAVGLPTSVARLHQASWQPAPPWGGDGSQPPPHMIHPGYAQPYYTAPPPYYRPGTMMHPPPDVAHQQISNGTSSSGNGESSSSRKSSPAMAVDPSLDRAGMEDSSETGDAETAVIDPSLVSPSASNVENGGSSTDGPASRIPETGSSPGSGDHIFSPTSAEPPNEEEDSSDNETTIVQSLLSSTRDHTYSSPHPAPLDHPLEMEQILTEDGEPMLNPAELLTQVSPSNPTSTVLDLMLQILSQESLASPPPS